MLKIVLLVSHNSFGADTIHFVFLESSGSLDWSAMSQIPPLANYFWVSFTVEQLLSSVQLFKCQFYRATLMVMQVSCKGRLQFLKFRNWSIPRWLLLRPSLLHAVLNWRNPLRGDDKNQMILALFRRWSSKSSKSPTKRLIVDSFLGACLNVGCMAAKKKRNTRKDNLSVILSSLSLSHRFMLSLSRVIH